jgi:phosphohistidine phosphatase
MRVLLMRHGEAIPVDEAYDEATRWLTPNGRKVARSVAASVPALGLSRIYTSPLTRAVQTAEILASAQEFEGPLTVWNGLAFGSTAQALAPLDECGAHETIGLVGHMPLVASMASELASAHVPSFKPAMLCSIAVDAARGRLEWLIDPDTLRRLGPADLQRR